MQTVTDTQAATRERKPTRVGARSPRRERLRSDSLRDVRAAWQSVLGQGLLSPEALEALLRISSVRQVAAGNQVLSRHEVVRNLMLLVQGDIGLGLKAAPAPLRIERSLHGPAWLDPGSAWLECCPASDGVALGDALLVDVSRSAYQALLARHPDLTWRTIVGLAEHLHAATAVTQDLMHKDAQARLAVWLLRRRGGEGAVQHIALHERKRDIASQLAVTPETLSRLLKQFSRDGLLKVDGYTIALLDLPGLQARAADDETKRPHARSRP
jgi:hypothetical protein